jgi:hypothetical protein
LPEAVERAITDVAAYDLMDPPSSANVVRYANALAKRAGMYTEPAMPADTEAILIAGRALLGLTPEGQQELCEGLEDGVRARLA